MHHDDFFIGMEFMLGAKRWRCTDVGTRTIAAIVISEVHVVTMAGNGTKTEHLDLTPDPSWFSGPTYAVVEHVIDEDSFPVCEAVSEEH